MSGVGAALRNDAVMLARHHGIGASFRGMMIEMAASPDRSIRVPIGFPAEMYEWLRQTAFERHSRMAEIVREAVQEYRERADPQLPLPMRRGEGSP